MKQIASSKETIPGKCTSDAVAALNVTEQMAPFLPPVQAESKPM
jgi:hypothetical protein